MPSIFPSPRGSGSPPSRFPRKPPPPPPEPPPPKRPPSSPPPPPPPARLPIVSSLSAADWSGLHVWRDIGHREVARAHVGALLIHRHQFARSRGTLCAALRLALLAHGAQDGHGDGDGCGSEGHQKSP